MRQFTEKNVLKNGIELGNWNESKPLTQTGKTYLNICCNWTPAYAGMTNGSDALVNFHEVALAPALFLLDLSLKFSTFKSLGP
jgi:hypothetical protein